MIRPFIVAVSSGFRRPEPIASAVMDSDTEQDLRDQLLELRGRLKDIEQELIEKTAALAKVEDHVVTQDAEIAAIREAVRLIISPQRSQHDRPSLDPEWCDEPILGFHRGD
jgi:hypothetical protein